MLVDPNKIDAAITQLRSISNHLANYSDTVVVPSIDDAIALLVECVNQGYGDRSEPTTYAHVLELTRQRAEQIIAQEHPPVHDVNPFLTYRRRDCVRDAIAETMDHLAFHQRILEVYMSKLDLLMVDLDQEREIAVPCDALAQGIERALTEDLADLAAEPEDEEEDEA